MVTMWNEWTYWLSSIPQDELAWLIAPFLLLDGLRYFATTFCVWIVDLFYRCVGAVSGKQELADTHFRFCPSISLIIAGLNEGENLRGTLDRLWGTYPRLQIIVVDDGSTDNMADVARGFAQEHPGVTVISKRRGGKSSAMNAGLACATGEVSIILDADSELAPNALWEVVQPLEDPRVGAVSGNVRVRNSSKNLLTRIQTFEYLRSVFLGRIVTSRLGMLGIVSGAFGAFRTSLLKQMGGWDVGPGEDEDVVLRLRKQGYQIEFVPHADCFTDVPESWKVLTRQRRRWEWAVVTFESRKHIDMANPLNKHFSLSNFLLFAERWVYNLLLPIWFWVYMGWIVLFHSLSELIYPSILFYFLYLFADLIQFLIILDYSNHLRRDLNAILVLPLMPFYQAYQRLITTVAVVEEMLSRRSFRDNFVPPHVRSVTWHW
jgi:poly-beta-1,6-N-acetyl-D-glucosamine synthase